MRGVLAQRSLQLVEEHLCGEHHLPHARHGGLVHVVTANTPESQRAARFRARVRAEGVVPEHVHGSTYGYNVFKCRCDRCREANRIKDQRRRAKVRLALAYYKSKERTDER